MDGEYVIFDEDNDPDAHIWEVTELDEYGHQTLTGNFFFTFDKKKVFNAFRDYPDNLTYSQKQIFDENFPDWAELLASRVHA